MTHDEFIQLLKQPEMVEKKHIPELKEMVSFYPYFAEAKVLLARAMLKSNNLHANHYVDYAALCVPNRRNLFFILFPQKRVSSKPIQVDRIPKYEGTYFDMIKMMEAQGNDAKESFKNLAQKLKEAREKISEGSESVKEVAKSRPSIQSSIPEYFDLDEEQTLKDEYLTEDYAKKLIKERKFEAALAILNKLNLIIPKKSVYFADQIRFLEKILLNTNK
jgi:hypothetical protein